MFILYLVLTEKHLLSAYPQYIKYASFQVWNSMDIQSTLPGTPNNCISTHALISIPNSIFNSYYDNIYNNIKLKYSSHKYVCYKSYKYNILYCKYLIKRTSNLCKWTTYLDFSSSIYLYPYFLSPLGQLCPQHVGTFSITDIQQH